MRCLLLLTVLTATLARTALPEDIPADVLTVARAVTVNRELAQHVASFTCLETIRRADLARNSRKLKVQDVVQVEVGVGGGQEVYSWPGQNSFSDTGLDRIIGHGMVATGLFQTFTTAVFSINAAIIRLIDKTTLHSQPAYHFRYQIPSLQTRWVVNWLGARGSVGEEGEFWTDASSFFLLRLTVNATDIPATLPLQHLRVTIDYRPGSIGSRKTLLPEFAAVAAAEWNGVLHRDDVSFSHCRVFGAESGLLLSSADLAQQVSQLHKNREILPPGLMLSLALETPVYFSAAMIGDKIRARLEQPVTLPDKSTIPKGAIAEGYLRQLEKLDEGAPYYQVGLEFDRMNWSDRSADFFAEALSFDPIASFSHATFNQHKYTLWDTPGIEYRTETFHPIHIPGVANFVLDGTHAQVPKGFRMVWKTQAPGRTP